MLIRSSPVCEPFPYRSLFPPTIQHLHKLIQPISFPLPPLPPLTHTHLHTYTHIYTPVNTLPPNLFTRYKNSYIISPFFSFFFFHFPFSIFVAMPVIRPTLEYKYQHREFRQKLLPPYGRSCPPRSGPKFRPTRPIYREVTNNRDNIRRILLQRRRVDGKVPPLPFFFPVPPFVERNLITKIKQQRQRSPTSVKLIEDWIQVVYIQMKKFETSLYLFWTMRI